MEKIEQMIEGGEDEPPSNPKSIDLFRDRSSLMVALFAKGVRYHKFPESVNLDYCIR